MCIIVKSRSYRSVNFKINEVVNFEVHCDATNNNTKCTICPSLYYYCSVFFVNKNRQGKYFPFLIFVIIGA